MAGWSGLGACEGMKHTIREIADSLSGIAKVGTLICDEGGGNSQAMNFCIQGHGIQAFPVSCTRHCQRDYQTMAGQFVTNLKLHSEVFVCLHRLLCVHISIL